MQKEPLRLWYRIGRPLDEVKVEGVKVNAVESPCAQVKDVKEVKVTRDTLVDITDRYGKRGGWSSNQKASKTKTPTKRRKRMNVKPEPVDVAVEKVKEVKEVKEIKEIKEIEEKVLEPLTEETVFDSHNPAEFCCSTPIPAHPVSGVESGDEVERSIKNWLPKAVFDLDDKALFAKRLLRETVIPSGRKPSDETPSADQDPKKVEPKLELNDQNDTPKRNEDVPASGRKSAGSPEDALMNPLRICVSPDEEVHDSIGALDLSGRSDSTDTSPRSGSLPAAGPVSASPGRNCSGPHPYFMTPSALYTSLELLKRPALVSKAEAASVRKHPAGSKLCWSDLFSSSSVQPAHHQPSANHLLNLNKYK